jgi:flagellar protein FlbD
MIRVTRLNDTEVIINSDLIEHIEPGIDTVIALINGTSFMVKEPWQVVVDLVVEFRKRIGACPIKKPNDADGSCRP